MKLTIESMTYGADGLAHADNGKAVFVQGAVAGDTVEAEVVQDQGRLGLPQQNRTRADRR